jgi:hypothetical protein
LFVWGKSVDKVGKISLLKQKPGHACACPGGYQLSVAGRSRSFGSSGSCVRSRGNRSCIGGRSNRSVSGWGCGGVSGRSSNGSCIRSSGGSSCVRSCCSSGSCSRSSGSSVCISRFCRFRTAAYNSHSTTKNKTKSELSHIFLLEQER